MASASWFPLAATALAGGTVADGGSRNAPSLAGDGAEKSDGSIEVNASNGRISQHEAPAIKALVVVVNSVSYGPDDVEFLGARLSIGRSLANLAGLRCDDASVIGRCLLVPNLKFRESGSDVLIDAGPAAFVPISPQDRNGGAEPIVPELTPGRAAFVNYDVALSGNPDTSMALAGHLHPAYRDGPNAFDADLIFFNSISGSGIGARSGSSEARLTNFVYRREWFERRVRVAVGRNFNRARGLAGGDQFDGIQFERFNVDNLGLLRTSGRRPIDGFTAIPGILQYRVGENIFGQLPIRAGRFEVGREFVDSFPRGGRLELVGVDGVARPVDLPSEYNSGAALFAKGTYDLDINIGRINGSDGSRPFFGMGSRYGLINDVSVDGSVSLSDRRFGLSGSIDFRLPAELGIANVAAAVQGNWRGEEGASATYEVNYSNGWDGLNVYLTRRWFENGGYRGIQFTSKPEKGEIVRSTRLQLGFDLRMLGDSVPVRVAAEAYRYRDLDHSNRFVELGLSRNFNRFGNLSISGRFGRDQFLNSYSSVIANWVVTFGSRSGTTLSYLYENQGSSRATGRATASIWGSSGADGNLGSRWQLSVDQQGSANGDATYRSRYGIWSASISRPHIGSAFGRVSARGAILSAAGELSFTQAIDSSFLVLRAPELANSAIFIKPSVEARTRFDAGGIGMVQNIPSYREFSLQLDDQFLTPGSIVDTTTLKGSVRPNRAYILKIPVTRVQSVRLYPELPEEARNNGFALIGDQFSPVEPDGSLYISDLAKAGPTIRVNWMDSSGKQSCEISLDAVRPDRGISNLAVAEIRNLTCALKE